MTIDIASIHKHIQFLIRSQPYNTFPIDVLNYALTIAPTILLNFFNPTSTPHRPHIDRIKTIKMRRKRKNNQNEEVEEGKQ